MKTPYLIDKEAAISGIGCCLGRGKWIPAMGPSWFDLVLESMCLECNSDESMDIIVFPSF